MHTMTARERVSLAINHTETDRAATGEITIADEVVEGFFQINGVTFTERAEFANRLGIDAVCESPQWAGAPSHLPTPAEAQWKDLSAWATETDRFAFAMLDGIFGWGSRFMGFDRFLLASVRGSQDLVDLINKVERLNIGLAKRAADAGADGVLIADDIAYNQGTTVSPEALRNFFFPTLARQVKGIASLKIPVFFHSDGNLNAVMDDLVGSGVHGVQCLEPAAGMDLGQLKARYGDRICLWGNLDPENLFLKRAVADLQRTVRGIIHTGAPGGGFIFGSTSGLVNGMRRENLEVAYRAVCEGGSLSSS
jgi:uroporphyrinogen decarboxylase